MHVITVTFFYVFFKSNKRDFLRFFLLWFTRFLELRLSFWFPTRTYTT